MKRIFCVLFVCLVALSSFSQGLDNKIYFRLGYSLPSWKNFGMTKDDWNEDVTRAGAHFDVGTIIQLLPIGYGDNMSIGLNIDLAYLNFNRYQVDYSIADFMPDGLSDEEAAAFVEELMGVMSSVNMGIFRAGSKIGPSFTYCPSERMAIDLYGKADIAWASLLMPYGENLGDLDDKYSATITVGYAAGFNVRYGKLMLGVEYDAISPKLEYRQQHGNYFQQLMDLAVGSDEDWLWGDEEEPTNKKSKLKSLTFTVGVCF